MLVTYPCIMKPETSHLTGKGLEIVVGLKDREPDNRNMTPEYFEDILEISVWNLRMKCWHSKGLNITETLGIHINGHSGEVAIGILKMNCHLRDLILILDLLVATEMINGTRDDSVIETSVTEETITGIFVSNIETIMMIEVMRSMIGGIIIEMLE